MIEPGAKVLIVDDQRAVREELAFALGYEGFATVEAGDGEAALAAVRAPEVTAVLLDVKLPGLDGLEVLSRMKELRPSLPVVMISGHGDIETAVLAVKRGAYDFLQKPFGTDRVLVSIKNALQSAALAAENQQLKLELLREFELHGESPLMIAVRALIQKVAPTDAQVLITGENGTGKELVARQVHAQSRRRAGPFVAVNCAAIPADLVESELFGHEKGAFTGATQARLGHFELAHGGTLFLDEVGDMPLPMQGKLLRALQERVVLRVGSTKEIPIDVRVLAATNQDLLTMVAKKEFREDLYYRLHVVRIHLPPLRDRLEDIELIAKHCLQQAIHRNSIGKRKLTRGALDWLRQQRWPGNVRQLKNVIEGAAILADGTELGPTDMQGASTPVPAALPGGAADWFAFEKLEDFGFATEKEFIRRKLLENGGNIKRTAERIDLQRSNLYKKLEKYGLK
ncbi:sigma-54-dependent Fis family transcriptional regulator [Planctomycetota bacterium]|jgi:DNA-binding NtrC family response regulator|nr:sigma-54 dependent transcriptional regulator [Planctomycetota bacterium]GDY00807.1 sigma-54-dependent Fis family transcriptional regulator [Planctomycetota bacterium]